MPSWPSWRRKVLHNADRASHQMRSQGTILGHSFAWAHHWVGTRVHVTLSADYVWAYRGLLNNLSGGSTWSAQRHPAVADSLAWRRVSFAAPSA